MTREERFWEGVAVSAGCWEHRNALGSHGYPQFGGTTAHRESWRLRHGDIPDGVLVLHSCNNKRCVRPDHLRLGTHRDNMDDVAKIGHPRRRLNDMQVREIRSSSATQRALATKHGITQRAVWNVRTGRTYRHV